jgi:alpha-L-rhamnosidase
MDEEFGEMGDTVRRYNDTYLGVDLPVLPGNPCRYELYTITETGDHFFPLIQGQQRWIRIQLDSEDTSVDIDGYYVHYTSDKSPLTGHFLCDNDDFNRLWYASVYTAQFASFTSDAWENMWGWLFPRKLEKSNEIGLAKTGENWTDYSFDFDFIIRQNPNHLSSAGWTFRAKDPNNGYVGQITLEDQFILKKRVNGKYIHLKEPVDLDQDIIDGKPYHLKVRVTGSTIETFLDDQQIDMSTDQTYSKGTIGFCQPKEHWAMVDNVHVTDRDGNTLLYDDFSGNLDAWDFRKTLPFLVDGSLRDRTPWIGDLDFAGRNVYYGYDNHSYMLGSLQMIGAHQTPEGFVWATCYPENDDYPESGEYGYWPSDEFSAWYVPTTADYLLYTGDIKGVEPLYSVVKKDLDYLWSHVDGGIFIQRKETSNGQGVGGDFGGKLTEKFAYVNILLHEALVKGAFIAEKLNKTKDATLFRDRASQLKKSIYQHFWNGQNGYFVIKHNSVDFSFKSSALALATGLVSQAEAERIIPHLNTKISYTFGDKKDISKDPDALVDMAATLQKSFGFQSGKFQSLAAEGKFRYGANQDALDGIRRSTWISILNDWRGIQDLTWESCIYPPFRPAGQGYRDMSHTDTAIAHLFSAYVLGVQPVEVGYREYSAIPHPGDLKWAKGRIPTPQGDILFRWAKSRENLFRAFLRAPRDTQGRIGIPKPGDEFEISINGQWVRDANGQFKSIPGVGSMDEDDDYVYFNNVLGGSFRFVVKKGN